MNMYSLEHKAIQNMGNSYFDEDIWKNIKPKVDIKLDVFLVKRLETRFNSEVEIVQIQISNESCDRHEFSARYKKG